MAKEITIEDKKVKTPKFRVSYPHVYKPQSYQGGDPKYSVTMIFDKNADLTSLKKAIHNAGVEKWGPDKTAWPKKITMPFRDGDRDKPGQPEYAGKIFITATANQDKKPEVVGPNPDRELIDDPSEFYAGCYARASLIAFAYPKGDTKGAPKIGLGFALQNIQKLDEGKKFSGKKSAAEDFSDDYENEDGASEEDEESYLDSDDGDEDGGF